MPAVILQDELVIPSGINSLSAFRRWTLSDDFPQSGHIEYIGGQIEVDMAPDRIYSHSLVVTAITYGVMAVVERDDLGHVLCDRTRIVSVPADLSCEPDLTFVSWESLKTGQVRYLKARKPMHEMDRIEVDGSPDLVVEIVSPTSVKKDTERLPTAYFAAGVREYWVADARTDTVSFQIYRRGKAAFKPVAPSSGFYPSDVLGYEFKLIRKRGPLPDTFVFKLQSHAR